MIKNKKVGIVFTSSIVGGHELMTIKHIQKYNKKGFSITSYIPRDNEKLKEVMRDSSLNFYEHNVRHRKLEIIHSFLNINYRKESITLIKELSDKFDFVVLIQGDIELGSGIINASKKLSKENVISYIPYTHSFKKMGSKLPLVKDFLAKKVYRNCNNYITICTQFSDGLKKENPRAEVRILKNFVEKPRPQDDFKVEDNIISTSELTILMAGRIYFRQKGQDTLINALKVIDHKFPIKLKIIGDGPDLEALIVAASELSDSIKVDFLGWQSDVWKCASDVDLLVIPSNYEGVPLIMLEAQKRKIPVIAPARDGMLDYLPEKYLYKTDGVEHLSLAEKIEEFIKETKSQ